jgi:hypothetical protein
VARVPLLHSLRADGRRCPLPPPPAGELSGGYCHVEQMTTSRQGITCDMVSEGSATAFVYSAGGLLYGSNAIMSDGSLWQLYYDPTSTTSNVLINGAPVPPPPSPVSDPAASAGAATRRPGRSIALHGPGAGAHPCRPRCPSLV